MPELDLVGSREILVVEDDPLFRRLLSDGLRRHGLIVFEAESIDTAMSHIHEHTFPLAILDLKLASGSSLTLIPELKKNSVEVRILVLTGYASIATAVEAIKMGATNYLPKPANVKEILDALLDNCSDPKLPSDAPTMSLERLEWEHIQRVLAENGGNISKTARQLNMHRRTLQRKLAKKPVKK